MQEAYARAWQQWEQIRGYADPEAWVRTVAYRIRVSRWRRMTAGVRAHRRHGAAGDVPEVSLDYVAIIAALRRLSSEQRRAVVLHHLVGRTVEEIADETGVAVGTVKSRLCRGRAALAQLLGAADDEDVARTIRKEAHTHA